MLHVFFTNRVKVMTRTPTNDNLFGTEGVDGSRTKTRSLERLGGGTSENTRSSHSFPVSVRHVTKLPLNFMLTTAKMPPPHTVIIWSHPTRGFVHAPALLMDTERESRGGVAGAQGDARGPCSGQHRGGDVEKHKEDNNME
jgi:hypothetical protein